MHDAAGKLHIIPADVKEKLHHLPRDGWPAHAPPTSTALLDAASFSVIQSGRGLATLRPQRHGACTRRADAPLRRRLLNRTADALEAVQRILLWIISGHFVDDFNGVDTDDVADSAFYRAWPTSWSCWACRPGTAAGAVPGSAGSPCMVTVGSEGVSLQPTPRRLEKIIASMQTALDEDDPGGGVRMDSCSNTDAVNPQGPGEGRRRPPVCDPGGRRRADQPGDLRRLSRRRVA